MTELPGAAAALAATPGATLAAARQAAGLSIADVAEQMRISPRQVEAIETNHYDALPGTVFVRGFVRNYARLLKLDPVPLLHALEPELGKEVPLRAHEIAGSLPETARRSHSSVWLVLLALLFAAVAAAAAYEWWRGRLKADGGGQGSAQSGSQALSVENAAPTRAPALSPLEQARDAPPSASPHAATPQANAAIPQANVAIPQADASTSIGAATGIAAATGTLSPPAPGLETPAVSASAGAMRVQIEFVRESWVELRDGEGKVQFSGTAPAGSTRNFEAKPPLDVVIGNASGVRITYNDKPFDVASHASRNIARFTLE